MKRALFRCEGCQLEVHLLAPVERPCPSCGGSFEEVEEEEEDFSILDLGFERSSGAVENKEEVIAKVIKEQMPVLMEEIDQYLAAWDKE